MNAATNQPDILKAVPALERMFRFQWEEAQHAYVLLYPEGMVKLNDSAGEILALVDGTRSVAEICAALEQKFPNAGDLSRDILEFMEVAHEQRWIHYG
ncbi:pyrroloquinoline quinone biosynthesis peptide chaperone PqqD [Marinobacterium litorale]|uniref:pyrroloquinoline quinone biosynthesis peptide chaperone PqqD n=1 Tax=Marinobacterium litorale TaxID=404770 RepID=UPI0003F53EE3|nr:pyrroloquinoline quinone biosynthesis peptide chaperone PqqD [Marinobacterium litorale]